MILYLLLIAFAISIIIFGTAYMDVHKWRGIIIAYFGLALAVIFIIFCQPKKEQSTFNGKCGQTKGITLGGKLG